MRRTPFITFAVAIPFLMAISPANAQTKTKAPAVLDDATIAAIFDAANTADIETGTLASKRGSTKEIRDFGATLANDHKVVRQQGRDLVAKLGVKPTPPRDGQGAKAHAAAMKQLRSLNGAAFDRAFLQHEVAFHKAVIEAVQQTLMPATKNAELKALVVKVAPAFQAHMMAAQQRLEQTPGTSTGSAAHSHD